ncbi:MAG: GlxA family transcriptional regulator [Gammaproteobacteria bacterium]
MTQRFVFLLLEDFSHLAFSCAVEPLRIANLVSGEKLFEWELISPNGETATCSNGTVTLVSGGLEKRPAEDRVFLISGVGAQHHRDPKLLNYLRHTAKEVRQLGGICSGAYVLARAGLLDGLDVAVHWEFHGSFQENFPKVNLQRTVFVADPKHPTASGGPAAADLMLHLIATEIDARLALKVADQMVYTAIRTEQSLQRVSISTRFGQRNPHLNNAIRLMEDNIEEPLHSPEIAKQLGTSVRQLERLFHRHMGQTPQRYYLSLRLERARHLLLQTNLSITEVSIACGFEYTSTFSRSFKREFGMAPSKSMD